MAFDTSWLDDIHSSILSDVSQEKINDKAKWPIFVYDWINKTPNTEAGLKEANELRTPHYQWSEIIKGNESVYLSPMNATKLTKHQGTGKLDPNTNKVDGSYYEVEYSKDDSVVFYGMKISANGGTTFGSTTFGGFGDFTTISDQETIQMKTTQKVSKDLLTKFFYIPDVAQIVENNNKGQYDQDFNDNDIFYISNYTNYFNVNNGDFIYSEITFENLQQNMAQSGQIIEQHVYLASPGAGYLVPKLLFDEKGTPIGSSDGWEWNTNFTQDRGVKTIQIEVQGNYAFCALEIWGYPVDPNHNDIGNKRWYAPRKLMVEYFRLPLDENFYKVSPNNAEFVIADGKLTATTDLKAYKTMVHNFAGDTPMTYQGIVNTTKEATKGTNISGYTINDAQFGYNDSYIDSLLQEDGKTKNTDFENFYTTDSQWFYDGQKNDGTDGIGQKTISLKDVHRVPNNDHSAVQLMNIMSFALQPINRLPFAINSKLTWSTADFPGFGGFVNKALLGMSPTWRTINTSTNVLMPKLQTLPMFINKDFYDLSISSVYESNFLNTKNTYFPWDLAKISPSNSQDSLGKVPMDFFQQKESDVLGAVMSNKSNSTTLTFTLTDKIQASAYDSKTGIKKDGLENISSVLLNQDVNGTKYKVDSSSFSTASLEDDNNVITDVNGDSYIITNIGFKGLGDGDVRITTFNDDIDNIPAGVDYHEYINFQTYIKTTASYKNGSIREWFTNLNTSYLDFLDKYINEKFQWPKELPIPQPEYYLPDITGVHQNISDFALWRQFGLSDNSSPVLLTYNGNNHGESANSVYNTSLKIMIHDFAEDGYSDPLDIQKNYEKFSFSSDKLNFALARLNSRQYQNGSESKYLGILNNSDSSDLDGKPSSTSSSGYKSFSGTLSDTIKLRDIKSWNGTDDLDASYVYKNNINSDFTGNYNAVIVSNEPNSINRSSNGADWYYFLYFDGVKLYINLFYEGKSNPIGSWYGYGMRSGSLATSLMLWMGGKNFTDINSITDWPQLKAGEGSGFWPSANEQLLGHSQNYWNIKWSVISYKLKKEHK